MLKPLRLRLTLLYLLVAMLLAGFVGFSSYFMIYYYFQNNNDAALKYKMASTFVTIGLRLPEDLQKAQQSWMTIRSNDNNESDDDILKEDLEDEN